MRVRIGIAVAATAALVTACAGQQAGSAKSGSLDSEQPGYDPASKTITVGALLPLSGPQASPDVLKGLEVYVKSLNAAGGIDGKYKLKVEALDSQYDVPTALRQYNGAKSKVAMFSVVLGGPTVAALLPQLENDDIMAQPIAGDPALVKVPNIAPVQTPYIYGVINGASYVFDKMDGKNKTWCAMNQDDITGQTYADGAKYASEKLGFKLKKVVNFRLGDTDVTGQIQQLKQAGCEVVFYNGVAGTSAASATASAQVDFNPQWITQIPAWVTPYAKSPIVGYMSKNWLMSVVGSVPWDDNSPGQQKLREDMNKYLPGAPPTHHLQWGYTYGMATEQILKQAIADGNISHAGVSKAVTELNKLSFDGIIPEYTYGSPDSRRPSSSVTIVRVDPSKPGYFEKVAGNYDSTIAQGYRR